MGLFDKIFKKRDVVESPKSIVVTREILAYYLLIIVHKPCAWMKIRSGVAVDPQSIEKSRESSRQGSQNLCEVGDFLNGKISEDKISENGRCVAVAIRDLFLAADSNQTYMLTIVEAEIFSEDGPRRGALVTILDLLDKPPSDYPLLIKDVESAKRRLLNLRG